MTAFGGCLVDGCYAFDTTYGNHVQAIAGRVQKYHKRELTPFSNRVFSNAGDLRRYIMAYGAELGFSNIRPMDIQDLFDHLSKPGQRRQLAELLDLGDRWDDEKQYQDDVAQMMVKRESYGKFTDPRCITMYSKRNKFKYICFVIPAMEWLKAVFPNMVCGMTPLEVANTLTEAMGKCTTAVNADAERLDGTKCPELRIMTRQTIAGMFEPTFREELYELQDAHCDVLVRSLYRLYYELKSSQGSGAGDTTLDNNLAMLFAIYHNIRRTKVDQNGIPSPNGKFPSAGDAITHLVNKTVVSGDDSVLGDVHPEWTVLNTAEMNLILKCEQILRGQSGISFCARFYTSEVWFGNPTSCMDLMRALPKLFVAVGNDCRNPLEAAVVRSVARRQSDANTPIVGALDERILQLAGRGPNDLKPLTVNLNGNTVRSLLPYNSSIRVTTTGNGGSVVDIADSVQFVNDVHPDYFHVFATGAPLEGFDFDSFEQWLGSTSSLDQLLRSVPVCMAIDTPLPNHEGHVDGQPNHVGVPPRVEQC